MCSAHAYHVSPPFAPEPSWYGAVVPCHSHKLASKNALCARTSHKSTGIRGTLLGIVESHTRHHFWHAKLVVSVPSGAYLDNSSKAHSL
jgi:hypothetical protein